MSCLATYFLGLVLGVAFGLVLDRSQARRLRRQLRDLDARHSEVLRKWVGAENARLKAVARLRNARNLPLL